MKNWGIWFVGLPGSGKSSIAKRFVDALGARGESPVFLQMDVRRRAYFPHPRYTAEERKKAYELFAQEAAELIASGKNVVLDGCAPALAMREFARGRIPRFAEIYVACPVEVAMQREGQRKQGAVMADLYARALERKETGRQFEGLGEVVGVDVPFEENSRAELTIQNVAVSLEQATDKVLDFFDRWSRAFS